MEIIDYRKSSFRRGMLRDIQTGMSAPLKYVPSKYLYDEYGSFLFERICELPEYYPTRTEIQILRNAAPVIMRSCTGDIVELGSGSSTKIRVLLDAVNSRDLKRLRYIPVDVSGSALTRTTEELSDSHPGLRPVGILADFMHCLEEIPGNSRRLIMLLGGTIGNLSSDECLSFVCRISRILQRDDRFLVGIDLIKDRGILNAAYNDSRGITAEFNRNVLRVINRELHTSFIPEHFIHTAFFNEEEQRIEIYLTADRHMEIDLPGMEAPVRIARGERILTEISRKFSIESAGMLFAEAGLNIRNWFTDPGEWFALVELEKEED